MIAAATTNLDGQHQTSRGFTLLEVLITLGITGAVLAAATLSLATYRRESSLSRAVSSLRLFVERAYSRALSTRQEVTVIVNSALAFIQDSSGAQRESLSFQAPVTPLLKDNKPQKIQLYPSISSSPTTITLQSGSHRCDIIISLRGRVRTQCD